MFDPTMKQAFLEHRARIFDVIHPVLETYIQSSGGHSAVEQQSPEARSGDQPFSQDEFVGFSDIGHNELCCGLASA